MQQHNAFSFGFLVLSKAAAMLSVVMLLLLVFPVTSDDVTDEHLCDGNFEDTDDIERLYGSIQGRKLSLCFSLLLFLSIYFYFFFFQNCICKFYINKVKRKASGILLSINACWKNVFFFSSQKCIYPRSTAARPLP